MDVQCFIGRFLQEAAHSGWQQGERDGVGLWLLHPSGAKAKIKDVVSPSTTLQVEVCWQGEEGEDFQRYLPVPPECAYAIDLLSPTAMEQLWRSLDLYLGQWVQSQTSDPHDASEMIRVLCRGSHLEMHAYTDQPPSLSGVLEEGVAVTGQCNPETLRVQLKFSNLTFAQAQDLLMQLQS